MNSTCRHQLASGVGVASGCDLRVPGDTEGHHCSRTAHKVCRAGVRWPQESHVCMTETFSVQKQCMKETQNPLGWISREGEESGGGGVHYFSVLFALDF